MSILTPYLWLDLLSIVALIGLYHYLTKNFNYWEVRRVLHLKPLLLFGNILPIITFQKSIGQFMEGLHIVSRKMKAGFIGFWIGRDPCLFVSDPDLIGRVLVKNCSHFDGRVMNNESFRCSNQPHYEGVQSRLSPLFTGAKLRQLTGLLMENAENAVKYIEEYNRTTGNEPINAKDVFKRCSTDSKHGISNHKAWEMNWFRFKFISNKVSEFLQIIFWKRKTISIDAEPNKDGDKIKDVLDLLLQLEESKSECDDLKHSGDTLMAQLAAVFATGVETSRSSMSLLLSSITRHPDIQNRLRKEIKDTMKKHSSLTYDALNEMTYLDMVLKETLRLYPTLPFVNRLCTKAYRVEGTNLVIDKGVKIYISLPGLQTDPRYWEDPEVFDPERFSQENKEKIAPFTYIPFGEGPNMCVGEKLGILQIKLGLAHILSRYRVGAALQPSEGRIPVTTRGAVISPLKPVMLFFIPDTLDN